MASKELIIKDDNNNEFEFDINKLAQQEEKEVVVVLSPDCPIKADSPAELFNIMTGESYPISKIVNKPIELAGVIAHYADMRDRNTQEMRRLPRIVLIDIDGNAFGSVSTTLFKALVNLLGTFNGLQEPISITIKNNDKDGKRFYTISVNK